jgi:hypothetical protein
MEGRGGTVSPLCISELLLAIGPFAAPLIEVTSREAPSPETDSSSPSDVTIVEAERMEKPLCRP